MNEPKDQAAFDQAAAAMGDNFPSLWHRLYEGCLRAGFSEEASMRLLCVYILSCAPNGIRYHDDGKNG